MRSRVRDFAAATPQNALIVGAWAAARALADLESEPPVGMTERFADWRFGSPVTAVARELGAAEAEARWCALAVALLLEMQGWPGSSSGESAVAELSRRLVSSPGGAAMLGVNEYEGRRWFHEEGFDRALEWLEIAALESAGAAPGRSHEMNVADAIGALRTAAARSGFDVDLLLEELVAGGLED